MFGSFGLRPVAVFDDGSDLIHQLGAYAQIGCFFRRIGNRIPDAGVGFSFRFAHFRILREIAETLIVVRSFGHFLGGRWVTLIQPAQSLRL